MTPAAASSARPWLSVIMPLHEGERWLAATLESLVGQAEDLIEIICIDSSPGPATARVAADFADRLPINLIHRPDVVGWPAKMNLAMEIVAADHACMLHQDDVWLAGRAAQVRRWIEADPDVVLHLAPTSIIDADGKGIGRWNCPLRPGRVDRDQLVERLLVQNFISVPAPVFRRDAWTRCSGMDVGLWYTADWDLWLKLGASGPVAYHDEVTTGFRVHGGSLTVTGSAKREEFKAQLAAVVERHVPLVSPARRAATRRRAMTSNRINCALADAMAGKLAPIPAALWSLARLGPFGASDYVRDSRIVERVLPRLRARWAGAF